eukprot:CAMPEP_0176240152 /NCGR_PEP_ID=MMETSP0121_2-20121125/29228_1 /TAXON_ID=160619 /ORGANISM="Kryptoperidinium foliaceum, Strain CCMP 1326" /LENGTH=258 /DNA_ID=CAMNT_0017579639 /DNA_START=200 /DNA_END=975 /DNA_ORIENTATION=-
MYLFFPFATVCMNSPLLSPDSFNLLPQLSPVAFSNTILSGLEFFGLTRNGGAASSPPVNSNNSSTVMHPLSSAHLTKVPLASLADSESMLLNVTEQILAPAGSVSMSSTSTQSSSEAQFIMVGSGCFNNAAMQLLLHGLLPIASQKWPLAVRQLRAQAYRQAEGLDLVVRPEDAIEAGEYHQILVGPFGVTVVPSMHVQRPVQWGIEQVAHRHWLLALEAPQVQGVLLRQSVVHLQLLLDVLRLQLPQLLRQPLREGL